MKQFLGKLDRFQQRHRPLAFGYGVVKKFGEDRGGNLAALITYYGFLSLFPLLLLFYTVSSYILPHFPGSQMALTKSVVGEFPVIGPQLHSNVHKPLQGSPAAILFGVVTLAWGALGVSQILQQTLYDVWGVPRDARPNFVSRVLRGMLLFALLGVGIVVTTAVAGVGSVLNWGPLGSLLAALPAALVNVGLFLIVFRLLSPPDVELRSLVPGAVVAGVGWQILQSVGVNLVSHQLRHSSQVYGVFAITLGLLSFLYLAAELTVYSAEINVVRARHQWPRSLLEKRGAATPAPQSGERSTTARPETIPTARPETIPQSAGPIPPPPRPSRPQPPSGSTLAPAAPPRPETPVGTESRPAPELVPATGESGPPRGTASQPAPEPVPVSDGPRPPGGRRWQVARGIR